MKSLALLISVFFITQLIAQTGKLTGKVQNEKGEPIIGASIIFRTDVTIGSVSDHNGNYLLEVPAGPAKLICRASGMITDTVSIIVVENKTITRDIVMSSFVLELEGVEVKVGKFDKPFEDQTVSMVVIRPELIENKNTRSIETALDQTPGLNILDGEPQIRGGRSGQL